METGGSVEGLIKSVDSLSCCSLDLRARQMTAIPDCLLQLRQLEIICLQGNLIHDLPGNFFAALPNVKWLDLRDNHLQSLPSDAHAFRACSLHNLLLESNNLQRLPDELGEAPNLSGLSLAKNPLEYPPSNIVAQGIHAILQFLRAALHKDSPKQTAEQKSRTPARGQPKQKPGPRQAADQRLQYVQLPRLPQAAILSRSGRLAPPPLYSQTEQYRSEQLTAGQARLPSSLQTPCYRNSTGTQCTLAKTQAHHAQAKNQGSKPMPKVARQPRSNAALSSPSSAMAKNTAGTTSLLQQQEQASAHLCAHLKEEQRIKDKKELSRWQDETRQMQRRSQFSHAAQLREQAGASTRAPFATQNSMSPGSSTTQSTATHFPPCIPRPSVQLNHIARTDHQLDQEKRLRERIQMHVRRMQERQTAQASSSLTPEERLRLAKEDLELAQQEQQLVKAARQREYRLTAFTAGLPRNDGSTA